MAIPNHTGQRTRPFSMRLRRLAPRMALLACVAVLFGGCIRAEIAVHVEDDGSGTASVLFAFEKSMLDLMGSLDESGSGDAFKPDEVFSDLDRSALPDGTRVEPYSADDFVGSRITVPFQRVEDLPQLLNLVTAGTTLPSDGGVSGGEGGFRSFSITRTEGGWRLDAVAEPLAPEGDGASDELGGDFGSALLEDASFAIKVKLPGKVQEHNADEVHGNELTWKLDFESSEPRELHAKTSGDDSGGRSWVLIGGGVVVLIALAGVGWDINRRRGRSTAS